MTTLNRVLPKEEQHRAAADKLLQQLVDACSRAHCRALLLVNLYISWVAE